MERKLTLWTVKPALLRTCKCLAAPHWTTKDGGVWGLQTTRQACVLCVRVGGRGARRQSLGTTPGMPSLQAKQEHGEHLGEGLQAAAAEAATVTATRAAPSAHLQFEATQLLKPADKSLHSAGFQLQNLKRVWEQREKGKNQVLSVLCSDCVKV